MNKNLSNPLARADVATELHPYTDARLHEQTGPIVIDRGEGIYVYDTAGNEYIEAMAGLWSVAVGFNEPRLVQAAAAQMSKLPYYHIFSHKSHEPAIRLGEKLVSMTPSQLTRVFFTNSGSEANDTVVKLVWYYNNALGRPKKKKFLARQKAYHGITVASGSLTGLPEQSSRFRSAGHTGAASDLSAFLSIWRMPAKPKHSSLRDCWQKLSRSFSRKAPTRLRPSSVNRSWAPAVSCRRRLVTGRASRRCAASTTFCWCPMRSSTDSAASAAPSAAQHYGFKPDIMVVSKQLTSSYVPLAAVLFSEAVYSADRRQQRENRHLRARLYDLGTSAGDGRCAGESQDPRRARPDGQCGARWCDPADANCAGSSPRIRWWERCVAPA